MQKKLMIILFVLIGQCVQLNAQQGINLLSVDKQTYEAWLKQDWDKLILLSTDALHAGIDFYYLRVRLGIAYYAKGNYHAALPHFEEAYRQNQQEDFLKESLYYTYVYTDRWGEANTLSATFSPTLKQKTNTGKKPFVNRFELAYGYQGLADHTIIDTYRTDADPLQNAFQYIPIRIQSVWLGLQHPVSNRFQFYHAFTGLSVDHFRYVQQDGQATTDNPYHTDVWQYYASGNWSLTKNLNLVFGGQLITVLYPVTTTIVRQGRTFLLTETYSDVDYLAFATLYQKFSYGLVGGGFTYGTVNNARQYQTDLKLTLFPLGNKNLYATTTGTHQRQESVYGTQVNRWIVDQTLGFKLTSRLWLEGYATLGDMENLIMNDGLIVYNRMDVIKNRYGARLFVFPSAHWGIQLQYGYMNSTSSFIDSTTGTKQSPLHYGQHSISGLVTWKF
jgi:tetratricopeptide (TPR) repeat protein